MHSETEPPEYERVNMSTILITGSNGFIGKNLQKKLLDQGHTVYGVDITHGPKELGWQQTLNSGSMEYARCDISHYRQIERVFDALPKIDYVYNAAAEFGRWNGEDYYEQLWTSNAIGTKNIIRLQEQHRFKLIHFSSSEVYGDYEGVMKEDVMDKVEIKQMNDYAMSKWVNEMQIRNSGLLHQTETVIVRFFNLYGPGETYHPYRSANCKFCYHSLVDLPVTVFRNHIRSSCYIDDASSTLSNIVSNFKAGEVYNIGSNEKHNIEQLVELIWQLTGAPQSLITYADSEVLTTKSKSVDTTKAEGDLAHNPVWSLEKGLEATIGWMRAFYGFG